MRVGAHYPRGALHGMNAAHSYDVYRQLIGMRAEFPASSSSLRELCCLESGLVGVKPEHNAAAHPVIC